MAWNKYNVRNPQMREELDDILGVTAGIVTANKVLVVDSDKRITDHLTVRRTNQAAIATGDFYGLQAAARHDHGTNKMANAAPLIGLEGIVVNAGVAPAGTAVGINAAIHILDGTGAFDGGAVWRGIQIVCNQASTNRPAEQSGLCIWNMAGDQDDAINVVCSDTGFRNLFKLTSGKAPVGNVALAGDGVNTNKSGTIAIKVGADTRYIPFYAAQ